MASLRQIIVDWTTASGAGKVSVLYFDATVAVATQRTALHTFLTAVKATLDNSVTYTIRTAGVEVDEETGTLTGAWSETSVKTGTGAGTADPVADATQVLVRWQTATIFAGRFLTGRMFIPGLSVAAIDNGNLNTSTLSAIQTPAVTFATAAGLQVWHRPNAEGPGFAADTTGATVWKELAVLRRRRY